VLGDRYQIDNIDQIDSPALVVFPDLIAENCALALKMLNRAEGAVLRPHIKTVKTPEVAQIMLDHGIDRFKCSTIAEAEMLAMSGAPDVLLAYQPTAIKINRLAKLVKSYHATHFSCLVDNRSTARLISDRFGKQPLDVYIDVNVGMNRTGVSPSEVIALIDEIKDLEGIRIRGLHAYDGQIRATDPDVRQQETDISYGLVKTLKDQVKTEYDMDLKIVVGGTPSYPFHSQRAQVECSPGTFAFWDAGYGKNYPDMQFQYAAILLTRIISIIDAQTLCLDLGSKAVAPDPALPRVVFPDHPEATVLSQSEEHLVVKVKDTTGYKVGDVWKGVPIHICPTVNLYEQLNVIHNRRWTNSWTVVARKRVINV
jgi:D-serine deaminase-like pyridoxal phosphate-dependent protein